MPLTPRTLTAAPWPTLALAILTAPAAAQTFDSVASPTGLGGLGGSLVNGGFVDFDRDGIPDTCGGEFSLFGSPFATFFGQGDGTFTPGPSFTAPLLTQSITLADADGDGWPDVLLSRQAGTAIYLNDGGTGFTANGSISSSFGLQVYDFTGDGLPDVVGASVNVLSLHAGLGGGSFGPPVTIDAVDAIAFTQPADVDRDGDVDLVVVQRATSGNRVTVLRTEPGSTPTLDPPISLGVTGQTYAGLGDFDEDGFVDVVVSVSRAAEWVRGSATGFAGVQPIAVLDAPLDSLQAADFDGDGHVDIATSKNGDIEVFAGDGAGNFAAGRLLNPGQRIADEYSIVDTNGDGWFDLAYQGMSIAVLRQIPPALPGATPFGGGTPPCLGAIGISCSEPPRVGAGGLRIQFTNAPAHSQGVMVIGGPADPIGVDPGFGVRMHTGQSFCSTEQWMSCDASGLASAPLPVPPITSLVGLEQHAQGVFLRPLGQGDACSSPPLGLLSSRALTLQIQP